MRPGPSGENWGSLPPLVCFAPQPPACRRSQSLPLSKAIGWPDGGCRTGGYLRGGGSGRQYRGGDEQGMIRDSWKRGQGYKWIREQFITV